MLNEFVDAEYYLAKAESKDDKNSDVVCLKGIIAAKKGDLKSAKKYWKQEKQNNALAAKNYAAFFEKKNDEELLAQGNSGSFNTPIVDNVNLSDPSLKSNFDFEVIKMPGLKISYIELESSTLIEVYGGAEIDYRFQRVKRQIFETPSAAWESALNSSTSTIEINKGYNLLRATNINSGEKTEFIKYVWY
jgi:hypothetical protein